MSSHYPLSLEIPASVRANRFLLNKDTLIHCDGLLSCTTSDPEGIHVWNPYTQSSTLIKLSHEISFTDVFEIGYAERGKYMVLRIHAEREGRRNVEVYADSWKTIGKLDGWYIDTSRDGLSLGDKMVWFAHENDSTMDYQQLAPFCRFILSPRNSASLAIYLRGIQ